LGFRRARLIAEAASFSRGDLAGQGGSKPPASRSRRPNAAHPERPMPLPEPDLKRSWNRDDEQKPGRPPETAYVPDGAEESTRSDKTLTDPATGAPNAQPPVPNQADSDERPGS
jgi:hypothetical protein